MGAYRLDQGGAIDRAKPLSFTFDGQTVQGFAGDTVASALLAGNIRIVARSFKYHRPRGLWGHGSEEPNALIDVSGPVSSSPNNRATVVDAVDGLKVRSVNNDPTAKNDRFSYLDRFSRFIPAAFYYKTFIFPDWHLYEPNIREMAGLGKIDRDWEKTGLATQRNMHPDVLVVGMGPAGLMAALEAAEAGKRVIVADEKSEAGGALSHRDHGAQIDGKPAREWVASAVERLKELGATLLTDTTAFGIYDHGVTGLNQRHGDGRPDTLWRVYAKEMVLATGAIERPLPFANNDLPGIMSADAGLAYLRRHGVVVGREIVIAANNSSGLEVAEALAATGTRVLLIDSRADAPAPATPGIRMLAGRRIVEAQGKMEVTGVVLDDGSHIACDAVLASGGWTPTIHLYGQSRGKLRWDEPLQTFVPGTEIANLKVVGAANGVFTLSKITALASPPSVASRHLPLKGGDREVEAAPHPISPLEGEMSGRTEGGEPSTLMPDYSISPIWPKPGQKGRVWIDFQNDVTAKDVELAARENFTSVEHLKRYTTLGMATDQGKTSNLNGLALMAAITGRTIPEVGTTTYRPPFTPVPIASFAGKRSGNFFNPVRRLPLENIHRADGAVFWDYGGWLRPAFFGKGDADTEIAREVRQARESVALFDGSTLGKIEVIGPQAAEFLDFMFYNTVSTLKPGKCRYCFILTETGIVYDDGVLVRLADDHFVVSCSSSHVAGVHSMLEDWRQDRFDRKKVYIHNATANYATLTVTGPRSRDLLSTIAFDAPLDDATLPHMSLVHGSYRGDPVRITRVSFTGDRSYEITIRADRAEVLWNELKQRGRAFDAVLMGSEALLVMRAEKGYIIVGKDTDGLTRPADMGLHGPLKNKKVEFLGRRSLMMDDAQRKDRKEYVGLEVADGGGMLAAGAHGVEWIGGKHRSIGYVTSSYMSPTLNRPIALGLIERGISRQGEIIDVRHMGEVRKARIVGPSAFDPEGGRLNA
ncbi:sarcosine oxidase subunit alpha family protein [Rhizobium sp. TH2]|uniref:sarcosine oxidase subunit alpha family protein n=1 Tax=Rhizobium sp. TH2 TaxID=2775403 RepID=UPI00215864BA|nr:sarcosine oxidase subunit alpha family protein [Rhizobium sp. TH2]UVC09726.1 sarcosine oxidase subunit alpha family protein [Rhizobium sp. TH2]